MASLSDSAGGAGGGRAGAELMVPQFLLKALHAILAVRVPRPLHSPAPAPAAAAFRRRDRWFHLPLHAPPPPPAAERLPEPSPGEPLVVDVFLAPAGGAGPETVVERWTVACEPWPAPPPGEGVAVNRAYKRCITLLRSLYVALRVLPAYRAFRMLSAPPGQAYNYEMGHRVGSFAAPFSRAEEAAMRTRNFEPVETQLGRLVVSVQYLPTLAAFNFEVTSLATAAIITDYVGSPAAEPMRAFPASLTEATGSAFPPPSRRTNSWTSPAPWPHSPGQQAKFSPPQAHYASPTPSPPTFAGGYLHSRFSTETAPVNIPQAGIGRGPFHHRNMSEPNRAFMFPPPSPKNVHESPSETSRSFRRGTEGFRMGDLYANLPAPNKIKDSRDESGRFSGVLSSSGSPRHGFSRSSSRLSMQDDTDDADFPFAVDDVDPDPRPGSSSGREMGDQAGSSSHKSQEAAVGQLIHLLKSARPLRDPSYSSHTSRAESVEAGSITSSSMSRRTSDALDELESFKVIKESLLARSRSRLQDSLDKP